MTELQTRILEALERYRYLTASQFQQIGISHSLPVIWRALRELTVGKRSSVGAINFPARMRVEHVERVHYLSRYGADVLADILGVEVADLDFCATPAIYHRDYWHRKYCVDFHIWLTQALETAPWDLEIATFDRYFDKTGANRTNNPKLGRLRARTRLELPGGHSLIPDITFVLRSASQPEHQVLYCMEMCNGHNTKRVLDQIEKHALAMRRCLVARAYSVAIPHRLLVLFEHTGLFEAVERRVEHALAADLRPLLFLGEYAAARQDVLRCWRMAWREGSVCFVTGR